MKLRWMASASASFLHAAAAVIGGRPLADERVAAALGESIHALRVALEADGIVPAKFFAQAVPLSVGIENDRELAEVAITKCEGSERARGRADRYVTLLGDLKRAGTAALPGLVDELAVRAGPLQQQWEARGPGLLAAVGRLTEPDLVVETADVVLIHPMLGGAGEAHTRYNSVRLEAVLANPVPELSEVLRLGWMLALLNTDLPRYREVIRYRDAVGVSAWSMLPPVLVAAETVELARYDPATLELAARSWGLPSMADGATTSIVADWWEAYRADPTRWTIALAALDQLLAAT